MSALLTQYKSVWVSELHKTYFEDSFPNNTNLLVRQFYKKQAQMHLASFKNQHLVNMQMRNHCFTQTTSFLTCALEHDRLLYFITQ